MKNILRFLKLLVLFFIFPVYMTVFHSVINSWNKIIFEYPIVIHNDLLNFFVQSCIYFLAFIATVFILLLGVAILNNLGNLFKWAFE